MKRGFMSLMKKSTLSALLVGSLLAITSPVALMAQSRGGGGHASGGGHSFSGGRSSGSSGGGARGFSGGGGARGFSGGSQNFSAPRGNVNGGARSFSAPQRGFNGGAQGFRGGENFRAGGGFGGFERGHYYGPGYYGGRYWGGGYWNGGPAFGLGFGYDPYYGCNPAGYYDAAGYWHPYPGCVAGPDAYGYGY